MEQRPTPSPKSDTRQIKLIVSQPTDLMTLLRDQVKGKSRTTIKSYLAHRQVMVDQKVVTQFNYPLTEGQQVTIALGRVAETIRYKGMKILFEDADLIVVEKEAGILSVATAKEKIQTVYSLLSTHVKRENPKNRIFVLHRLDRETSGVMVFAKSEEVQSAMQLAWQSSVVERIYMAVVEGVVKEDSGTIRSFLKENKALVMYSTNIPGEGDEAITHFRVLRRTPGLSLVEIQLETGRKNQIRVHMKDLGHPIIGDQKYGSKKDLIGRIALHACVLSFVHPVSGEPLRFETAVPGKFLSLFHRSAPSEESDRHRPVIHKRPRKS